MCPKKKIPFKDAHSILYRLGLIAAACLIITACAAFYAELPKLPVIRAVDDFSSPTRSHR